MANVAGSSAIPAPQVAISSIIVPTIIPRPVQNDGFVTAEFISLPSGSI